MEHGKAAVAFEVPREVTQDGIAEATWIDVPHFSQYVRPLIRDGLVEIRTAHVKAGPRRRKAYILTDRGKLEAIRLRDKLIEQAVRVRDGDDTREATVGEVMQKVSSRPSMLRILRSIEDQGVVDLDELSIPPKDRFVEAVADMPHLRGFVGREKELAELTMEDGVPPILVVRGVAGIGKTSLAAKACELLRGKKNLFWHRIRAWDTRESILGSVGDFLARLGRPGVRAMLRRGEGGRASQLLREDLRGTTSVLVFDDAHEASPEALQFFRLLVDAIASANDVRAIVLSRKELRFYSRRDVVIRGVVGELDLGALEPRDVALYFAGDRGRSSREVAQRLRGHPLFLELVRAHGAVPQRALRDARRFVKEEIYSELTEAERQMMKVASLYSTPVPQEALFFDPGLGPEVLLSLSDRSLIRPVGEERHEAHDTIREFFRDLLTHSERRGLAAFAVEKLRELAQRARGERDAASAIDFLSNAVRIETSERVRAAILEELGDAHERVGDLVARSNAYREALKLVHRDEDRARLHRKLARAFGAFSRVREASEEIEEGFRALGSQEGAERGWLELARSEVLHRARDPRAWDHAQEALRAFRAVGEVEGEANTYYQLAEMTWFFAADEELDTVTGYFREAIDRINPKANPDLLVRVRMAFASFLGRQGDMKGAAAQIEAAKSVEGALESPYDRLVFFQGRAQFLQATAGDFEGAKRDREECLRLAQATHDIESVAEAKYHLSHILIAERTPAEARRMMMEVAAHRRPLGVPTDNELYWAGEYSLMEGNLEAFHQILTSIRDPSNATRGEREVYHKIHEAWGVFLHGDRDGAVRLHSDTVNMTESLEAESGIRYLSGTKAWFNLGVALRIIGREDDGDEYIGRTLRVFRERHNEGAARLLPVRAELLAEGIKRIIASPEGFH